MIERPIISLLVLMMQGCESSIKPQALNILANLKQPCPELFKLESGIAKDVLRVIVDDRCKYVECSQSKLAMLYISHLYDGLVFIKASLFM